MVVDDLPRTLPDAVRRAAHLWPERTAWIFDLRQGPDPAASAELTFADIAERVDATASRLLAAGVQPGDRVATLLDNRPELPLTWLALASIGAVTVPLSVKYREADAGYILRASRCSAIVTTSAHAHTAGIHGLPVWDGVELTSPAVLDAVVGSRVHDPDDIVSVQFTSGTTGHPKGCLLSHDYWLTLARSLVTGFPRLGAGDRMLTAQAMSYMDPQWNLAASLVSGASLVVLDGFHPSTFWERVREHGVTYFYCLAAMPIMMLSTPADPRDRDHRVRVVQCSAIPPMRHADLERRWGAPWFEVFGMTETGGDIHVTDADHDRCVGSGLLGRAKPGREARIVGPDGAPLPPHTTGELVIRGRGMMSGYDGDPEATAEVFRGGWLHTGDLATIDEQGYVRLVGRLKDMIRRSGENVAAREVEEILQTHPSVRMAAVVAVPDDLRGEEIKAYVVVDDDRDAAQAADELHAFCCDHLARFKVPRFWEVRADLPRTASERVAKTELLAGPTWDIDRQEWC